MATAKTSLLEDLTATPSDELTRMVYADALDVAGDDARAAFVRSGEVGPELLAKSLLSWRRTVSPAAIGYCPREDCPKRWDALAVGDTRRRCGPCARDVVYGSSIAEIAAAARERLPVVFDPVVPAVDAAACYRREIGLHTKRVSELPLFADGLAPADIPELEIALGVRIPRDDAKPPRLHRTFNHPSGLIHAMVLHVHRPAATGEVPRLHCFHAVFATERAEAEARLAARFGPPVVAGDVRRYGPFGVSDDVDFRWSLRWISSATAPTRPSELPLFAWTDVPVRVGELETALHIQLAEPLRQLLRKQSVVVKAREHITDLRIEARAPFTLPSARDLFLASVRLTLDSDREACDARLRERYGDAVIVRRGGDALRMYGPFFVATEGRGLRVEWYGRRPTWAHALADRRDGFLAAMVDRIGRADTLEEIWQLRPSDGSGCAVGWTDIGNVIIAFRPALRVADLAEAFGWPDLIAAHEPYGHVLHVASGNSVVLPTCGRFTVQAHVDGAPTGSAYKYLELLRHLGPTDMVKFVIVTLR